MSLSNLSRQIFVQFFGGLYEHSPWVVERAYDAGLSTAHDNPDILSAEFQKALEQATHAEQLGLIRAHPDLVGKAAIAGELTTESTTEQSSAGLDQCSEEEFNRFTELNTLYKKKFDFPFVMAVREQNRADILKSFEHRLGNSIDPEFNCALIEINKIARLRLDVLLLQRDESTL